MNLGEIPQIVTCSKNVLCSVALIAVWTSHFPKHKSRTCPASLGRDRNGLPWSALLCWLCVYSACKVPGPMKSPWSLTWALIRYLKL